jgi:hypothetical protein
MAQIALIAFTALSAVNSIQAGNARGRQLHLQAEQASLEGKQRALAEEQKANMVLAKLNETNAAVRARGSAGGVNAFEGSAALIQDVNTRRAGKEFEISLSGAAGAERMGEAQKSMYASAANQAEKQGYFNAAMAIAQGGYQYSQLGSAPAAGGTGTISAPSSVNGGNYGRFASYDR